ncbi:hypothetical protein QUF80_15520 [Desulfococcaceae bacterium HSG8]|nr:hypothetical protein [Desulfococcaceae bacterium HSG8]
MHEKIIPSDAISPDLDWSQIRETVFMLNLAVAQIERAMREGDDSVTELSNSFTSMMENVGAIGEAAEELPDSGEKFAITKNFREISEKMNTAIVAFQFYDKLAQRLSHVCQSLASLGELITNPYRLYNPREWRGLKEKIKSRYHIDSDKQMFDAILRGASIEEALEFETTLRGNASAGSNVELF